MTENKEKKKSQNLSEHEAAETTAAILTTNTIAKAAERLGVVPRTVYRRINKYDIREIIEEIPSRALDTLRTGSLAAAEEFVEELRHRDVDVRQEAAKEILDRVGVSEDKKSGVAVQAKQKDGEMEVNFVSYNED